MLIVQITDTHIGTGERARPNDARLEQVVARVAALAPDLVIVSGDLTEDGSVEAYRQFAALMAPLDTPMLLGLGNHDLRAGYFAAFPDAPQHEGYAQHAATCGPVRIVMLDTLDEGWSSAAFCPARAAWLDACLSDAPDTPTLIVLHHPPVRTGVDWIDVNADGRWADRLAAVVSRHPQIVGLIAGHVHRPIATSFAGRPLLVAASTAYPVAFDPRAIDPAEPDGRALIVAGAPGFAVHSWTGPQLVTSFMTAPEDDIVARFDRSTRAMIVDSVAEADTHDL